MFLNLLFWSLMATTAMTTSPAPSTPIAQKQNQSVSSTKPSEAVRIATKNAARWFKWYVGWAVLAVLVSVFLTWMVWRSGNLLQAAAVADANEAAGQANKAAGEANERAAELGIKLENAKKEVIELQERVRPRALDESEVAKVRENLAAIKWRLPIVILVPPNRFPATDVAELFAKQLTELQIG